MAQISQETRIKVLESTDIVDLISSYIPVKRAGTSFKANCPFHNEKTPSFHINPQRQSFKCFGCGEGGDAISFVMKHEGLSFVDSIRKLAAKANIPIVEEQYDAEGERHKRKRGRLLELHRETARYMHELLLTDPQAKHARAYLKSRGYGKEMAVRWLVGWMPADGRRFLQWAKEKKFTGRELVDSGICAQREQGGLYVRFRDRLMFPVCNEQAEVIAFSGRQIIADPNTGKYINSPETALFLKSKTIFAFDRARKPIMKQKAVLICEGQLDALACHEHGIDHAIATLGTACTAQHAKILKRYTDTALLCFDADQAGYTACERAFRELASENIHVRVVSMPTGDDPDSFLKREGPDAFRELLQQARPFFDFKIDRAQVTGGMANAQARGNTAREIAALLAAVVDPVTRDSFLNHCATRLQMSAPDLRSATANAQKKQAREHRPQEEKSDDAVVEASAVDPLILYLCHLALHSAVARQYLGEQYETIHDAAQYLEGIPLLEKILSAEIDPEQPAAVNSFLADLPAGDRLALQSDVTFDAASMQQSYENADEALAKLSEKVLNKRYAINQSALTQPGLSAEQMMPLLQEAQEISQLLTALGKRTFADDRASLGETAKKKPAYTKSWKNRE
ncbi:MAG: primase [Verrucomicrobiota bacterium]